eukprot:TRINITY_DN20083_c0_g1_i1.p2 TRINITY_DN20083_c0_g1~~TRINITY_DN20083_c0_g1_i1.p2  ORF type:complete len:209 (-),score=42.71 TRINITY_DN20083_c0_g1_i1:14-640(-)
MPARTPTRSPAPALARKSPAQRGQRGTPPGQGIFAAVVAAVSEVPVDDGRSSTPSSRAQSRCATPQAQRYSLDLPPLPSLASASGDDCQDEPCASFLAPSPAFANLRAASARPAEARESVQQDMAAILTAMRERREGGPAAQDGQLAEASPRTRSSGALEAAAEALAAVREDRLSAGRRRRLGVTGAQRAAESAAPSTLALPLRWRRG